MKKIHLLLLSIFVVAPIFPLVSAHAGNVYSAEPKSHGPKTKPHGPKTKNQARWEKARARANAANKLPDTLQERVHDTDEALQAIRTKKDTKAAMALRVVKMRTQEKIKEAPMIKKEAMDEAVEAHKELISKPAK